LFYANTFILSGFASSIDEYFIDSKRLLNHLMSIYQRFEVSRVYKFACSVQSMLTCDVHNVHSCTVRDFSFLEN